MRLHPKRVFADAAFAKAAEANTTVTSLSMSPQALSDLERRLRSAGMLRETGFRRNRPGTDAAAARYRGADVHLDRRLQDCFLAKDSEGAVHRFPLDRHSRTR